jgi:hypothetical protein
MLQEFALFDRYGLPAEENTITIDSYSHYAASSRSLKRRHLGLAKLLALIRPETAMGRSRFERSRAEKLPCGERVLSRARIIGRK